VIKSLDSFPDNVVALIAEGRVTRKDYEQVVIPNVEAALKRHEKIRLYYELGSQFSGIDAGAAWEDFKTGFEHLPRWERVAVVTDVDWISHMVKAFGFLMPGHVRVFGTAQNNDAKTWILEKQA